VGYIFFFPLLVFSMCTPEACFSGSQSKFYKYHQMAESASLEYEDEKLRTEIQESQMLSSLECDTYLTSTTLFRIRRKNDIYAHYVGKFKLHKI
jgi:hypothetical protein